MKKIIILTACFFFFNSCQIEYHGGEKVRFMVETIDSNSNPIEGIQVNVRNKIQRFSETISKGKTKSDGKLELIFPMLDKDTFNYEIEFKDPNLIFGSATIYNISNFDLSDLQFILPPKIFPRNNEICTLEIILNQTNENRIIKSVNIEGLVFDYYIDFQKINDEIDEDFPVYMVFKNQVVTLNYSILDQSAALPTTESFSVQIPIPNQNSINYTINL